MNKILLALLLSFPAHASFNDVDKAQVLHQNMLQNPGFENGLAGWSASGGVLALVTSGTNLLKGKSSVTWDSNGAAQTYCSALVPVEEGDKNENGLSRIKIKTPSGTATHVLYASDGTSDVGPRFTVSSDTTGVVSQVNFIYPSTGSVQLCLESVNANEPLIAIDLGYQGFAANITSVTPNSMAQSYTPVFANLGTTTGVDFTWSQDGIYMDITGTYTTGTAGAGEVQIGLPPGYTIASEYAAVRQVGTYFRVPAATTSGGAILATAGDTFLNMGPAATFDSSAVSGLTVSNAPQVTGNSETQVIIARVMIAEFASSVSAFKADQTNRPWTAYTPTFTGFGTVTGVDCRYKRQGEDMLIRCRFVGGTSTAVEARVSLPGSFVSKSEINTLEVAGVGAYNTSGNFVPFPLIEPNVAYLTMGIQSGSFAGYVKQNGNVLLASGSGVSFTARIPIEGWEETMNAPLIKNSVVTSDNQTNGIESAFIEASGANTITQTGDWVTSLTDSGTGVYTVNIKTGIFSAAPSCQITGHAIGAVEHLGVITSKSNTAIGLRMVGFGAGADADADFEIECKEAR